MEFKRARSEEQKQQRTQGILAAADKLLDSHAYGDITMQMLADEVGFSRTNLGYYAETKEDIFLQLYVRDMRCLCRDMLEKTQDTNAAITIEDFADLFVAACAEHKNFVRVGALLYSILEVNISAERLAVHKKDMMECLANMTKRLITLFPFLRSETAFEALHSLLGFLVGLYPATHPGAVQIEAMELAGYPPMEVDFNRMLRRFVVVLLHGYEATA